MKTEEKSNGKWKKNEKSMTQSMHRSLLYFELSTLKQLVCAHVVKHSTSVSVCLALSVSQSLIHSLPLSPAVSPSPCPIPLPSHLSFTLHTPEQNRNVTFVTVNLRVEREPERKSPSVDSTSVRTFSCSGTKHRRKDPVLRSCDLTPNPNTQLQVGWD